MPPRNRRREKVKEAKAKAEQIYINKANLFFARKQAIKNDWERGRKAV